MADHAHLISAAGLRGLSDKLYERRKQAALEVEATVKQLAERNDMPKVCQIIDLLAVQYAGSASANNRKGGLIGLAAVTVGMASYVDKLPLERIVPAVLQNFNDQDSRVRYYACEAMYNIAKVARGAVVPFFNEVFDQLCRLAADVDSNVQNAAHLLDRLVKDIVTECDSFQVDDFIPLLSERLAVQSPFVRQFLVSWVMLLDSVPDIDMLRFLPDFFEGLLNMLSDPNKELRQKADAALTDFLQEIKAAAFQAHVDYGRMVVILVSKAGSPDEFTRLTATSWIREFVSWVGDGLLPHYPAILGAILPAVSAKEPRIKEVATKTNKQLLLLSTPGLNVADSLQVCCAQVASQFEATRKVRGASQTTGQTAGQRVDRCCAGVLALGVSALGALSERGAGPAGRALRRPAQLHRGRERGGGAAGAGGARHHRTAAAAAAATTAATATRARHEGRPLL